MQALEKNLDECFDYINYQMRLYIIVWVLGFLFTCVAWTHRVCAVLTVFILSVFTLIQGTWVAMGIDGCWDEDMEALVEADEATYGKLARISMWLVLLNVLGIIQTVCFGL